MSYRLHVIVGDKELGQYDVEEGTEYVIGRDSGSDIVVPDRSVSRPHCSARVVAGGVEFRDLDSANKLYVDGQLTTMVTLRSGRSINLGMASIRVGNLSNQTGLIKIDRELLDEFSSEFESSSEISVPRTGEVPAPSRGATPVMPQASPGSEVSGSSLSAISSQLEDYQDLAKDKLAVLIATAKSLGQSTDLDQLLARIMDHMFALMQVRRGVIALTEDDGESFVPVIVRPETETAEMSSLASRGILEEAARTGQARIIDDAQVDDELKLNQSIVMHNIRAAVCAPLVANNVCLGAIYADFPGRASLYGKSELDFITAFASIAAVSLQNAQMTKKLRDDDRMKRDLEIAAEIQQGILPDDSFATGLAGVEFDWAYSPSRQVGGDFYDLVNFNDGRIGVAIGDVSGKSVGAALYMARAMSFLRAVAPRMDAPGEILTRVNSLLGTGAGGRVLFATTFFMIVDPKTGIVEWSNAGHNPMMVCDPADPDFKMLEAVGPPLGVTDDFEYETQQTKVEPGWLITLYTDGLTEARNVEGREIGVARVQEIVRELCTGSVPDITKALIAEVKTHIVDTPYLLDDIAILNIRIVDGEDPETAP